MIKFNLLVLVFAIVSSLSIFSGCARVQQRNSITEPFIIIGVAYERNGQHLKAISYFTKAIELDPSDDVAYYNRGISHGKMGLHILAISDFTSAIELSPRDVTIYFNRAISYKKMGRYKEAVDRFTEAINLDPEYARAYLNRAAVYLTMKEYEKAWDDVNEIKELGFDLPGYFIAELRRVSGRKE